ncbi:MAG: alanine racemase, partial [Oscillospiraceae bacterium]|nr:alanine racemase [Oscillospiraceae bacterium]
MINNKSYAGIDCFRFIAALLVITIHTSPLMSFSETGDFILTRVIARTAVPFFFMTSGFFMISEYNRNTDRLKTFIKSTLKIYAVSIIIYIPVNVYNGYFSEQELLPKIIKDIIFDGTMYHLWYLPAAALVGAIARQLLKKTNYFWAMALAFGLYLIGLFGDSYFGIAENIPIIKSFYELIFQLFDYTRNGVFFAPIFFIMGGFIAEHQNKTSLTADFLGFAVSLGLMLGEALILRYLNFQRHDSMYLFLLPCMFFLFNALLHLQGKRSRHIRTSALIIYIIHPMVIIGVRFIAKLLHMQSLFVENSLIHFFSVCFASAAIGITASGILNKCGFGKKRRDEATLRAWIEIDLNNLEHNVRELKKAMQPECSLMAVVKAGAYGHGAFAVSAHLNKIGVDAFAVATIDEGIALRNYGIRGEILILGYTDVDRAKELKRYNLMQTAISFEYAN